VGLHQQPPRAVAHIVSTRPRFCTDLFAAAAAAERFKMVAVDGGGLRAGCVRACVRE